MAAAETPIVVSADTIEEFVRLWIATASYWRIQLQRSPVSRQNLQKLQQAALVKRDCPGSKPGGPFFSRPTQLKKIL